MFSDTRPRVSTESVLICWTSKVGVQTPDRTATMKVMRSVSTPSAAASAIGSARWNPKAVSSESMPLASA